MKSTLRMVALLLVVWSVVAQQRASAQERRTPVAYRDETLLLANDSTPQARASEQPFVVEYYYKARWGYADEFLRLFKKNHLPVLQKQIELGRIVSVKLEKPRYHATEDGRWDFRVTISFKSAAVVFAPFDEAALIRQLYPDQDTFKREEQRRFEILLAHWDVPIMPVE